jgi:opacity protein-like surface antigen
MRANHSLRKWTRSIAVLAFGALLVPAGAWAQDELEKPFEKSIGNFGLHGGFVKVKDAQDSRFQGGLHLELTPARIFGIQGMIDYGSEEKFEFVGPNGQNIEVDVRTLPITLSGKLYIPIAPNFMPYGLGGGGWYHQKIDFSEDLEAGGFQDRDETNFGWHLGAGATLGVGPRVALFGEGRWIFLDPDRDLNDSTVDQIEDFDFNSSQFLAGVNFLF